MTFLDGSELQETGTWEELWAGPCKGDKEREWCIQQHVRHLLKVA